MCLMWYLNKIFILHPIWEFPVFALCRLHRYTCANTFVKTNFVEITW